MLLQGAQVIEHGADVGVTVGAPFLQRVLHDTLQARRQILAVSVKRTRFIQTDQYVVAVEVEMVFPVDDPSEPCYESETVQFLREIKDRAERGDVAWLSQKAKVYTAVGAA